MALLANVSLTNTFDTWRTRTNQLVTRINQFAINESSLYANTLTSNTAFTAKGTATVTGLLTASGRATIGTNLTVSGNTTIGAAGKTANVTGWFGVLGRASVSTNLWVSGNTNFGGVNKVSNTTGWFGVNGRATVATNLFVGGNTTIAGALNINGAINLGDASTDLLTVTGRATIGQNLSVSGNTTLGGANKTITMGGAASTLTIGGAGHTTNTTGWFGVAGRATVSTNLFVGANTTVVGRLGVGTSSPSVKIHSSSVSSGDGIMSEYTGSSQYASASVRLRTGVGTTNQREVHLYNYVQDASNLYGNFAIGQFNGSGSYIQTLAQYDMNGNIWSFNTAGAERLRIAASGEVVAYNSMTVTKNLTVSGNTTINGTTTDKSNALSQTLTDGATINWDVSLGRVATVTLGAAGRTMAAPTNLKVGTYILRVYQDGTGSRTITTWNSVFKWTAAVAPVLSTGASKLDIITFFSDGTNLYGSYLPDMR
jgi:hypothetical protein